MHIETCGFLRLENSEGRQQAITTTEKERAAVGQSERPLWSMARRVLFPLSQVRTWRVEGLGHPGKEFPQEGEERTSHSMI